MSTERRLKGLKTRQKSLLASFSQIKAFTDAYNEETDAYEVPVRLEHLVSLWNDFNAVQAELESLDENDVDNQLKKRMEFESCYFKVKGFLLSVNKNTTTPTSPTSSHSTAHVPASSSHVRLPDVKLPMFSGNLDSWMNFYDLYVSLVHSSHELSNIQKFYYLRSSLSGDALKLIQTIAITANNYLVAWTLLENHYQNPARLKKSYVDSLFEFPSLKRESATELRTLVERFEANVKVLKQLGEKTEFWDVILIRMLSIRLDPTMRPSTIRCISAPHSPSSPRKIKRRKFVSTNCAATACERVIRHETALLLPPVGTAEVAITPSFAPPVEVRVPIARRHTSTLNQRSHPTNNHLYPYRQPSTMLRVLQQPET